MTANNGTLSANAGVTSTLTQAITGAGALTKDGAGTILLTSNANSWAGGATIAAGTLQLGNGGASGNLPGASAIANNGTLAFNRSDQFTFGNLVTGTGGLSQIGAGTTILTANNSYAGPTSVTGGALYVNGTQTGAGPATVGNGATLGGSGRLGGNVTVQSGGTLAPGGVGAVPGTLTVGGDLTLQGGSTLAYSFGQAGVVGGPFNDLTNVGGNLALGGTLNVQTSAGGSFDPGVYRVINYAGTRSGTLALGTVPSPGNYFIQTSVDKQVNLVNTNGLTLNYWDGAIGPKNDGQVNGGSGVWTANGALTNDNWTGMDGALNAPWTQSAFAVFMGQSGIVSVDSIINGPLLTQGMQFAANGYTLVNNTALDALTLVGVPVSGGPNDRDPRGRWHGGRHRLYRHHRRHAGRRGQAGQDRPGHAGAVGDQYLHRRHGRQRRHAAGLAGQQHGRPGGRAVAQRRHAGHDRDVRHGARHHAGRAGQLQCRGGHQLRHHQRRRRQRRIEQAGQRHADPGCGQHLCRRHDDFRRDAAAGFRRGGSATGGILGNVANNGTLVFNRSNSYTFSGLVSGTGGVTQLGSGTTILTADNTYTGGTTISAGTLQLGAGGATGGIVGNVVNNGGLVFNRGNGYAFGGVISGTGSVTQQGAGTTVLSGNNSYTGATTVSAGGLYVNGDQTAATGATTVNNATLGGKGVIGGDVTLTGNSTLSPGDNSPAPGTLTIKGNLALGSGTALNYSFGQANVAGGPSMT